MTARTVTKKSLRASDDDSISITSTQESEADEERSYVVDRILAEQDDGEGNKYYLIRWDGYGLLASTWEPAENIEGQATLMDWTDEKMRVSRGLSKEFDVVSFEEELERVRLAKEERRERRKVKRERLGLTKILSESEEDLPLSTLRAEHKQRNLEADLFENESGDPVRREDQNAQPRSKQTAFNTASIAEDVASKGTTTTRAKRRTINLPTQDRIIDTSEDSIFEEREQDAADESASESRPRAEISRRPRELVEFISDESSSLSRSSSPFGMPQKSSQRMAKVEVSSRTSYRGTANRGAGATKAASLAHGAPPNRGASRGRPRGRGRGPVRGSGRGQERRSPDSFSFTAPNIDSGKPKRKRTLANAILNAPAVDPNKPTDHFKTPSMVRKAELAARSLADRAPDLQSIGLLSRPSDYGGGRPIRKKSQIIREESEMSHSNLNSASSIHGGIKTRSPSHKEEENTFLHTRTSPTDAEISARTTKVDLCTPNDSDQIIAEANRLSRDLPEGVPTGPRAFVQEHANTVKQLKPPRLDTTGCTDQPNDLDTFPPLEPQTAMNPVGDAPRRPLKSITKINLKEYKSRRKSEFLGDAVPAQVVFGNQGAASILIGFTDIDKAQNNSWLPILSGIGVLNFNRICIAQEFQTQLNFLRSSVQVTGNIIADVEGVGILEEVASFLRPCSGLLFIHDIFCILIFPTKCEEWKFLDSSSDIDHRIRYQIYEPKFPAGATIQLGSTSAEIAMSSLDIKCHYLETLVDLTQNLQYQALLPPHLEGQDANNFYLFFPKKAASSIRYIIAWLRACNRNCRIYTSQKFGSWDLFSNTSTLKTGTIIIHECLLPSVFRIPRVARLINGHASFNFWSIADGSCANPFHFDFDSHDAVPYSKSSMTRLFPHGGAIFLTPSFLITQPERTCELLKWFQKKLTSSTQGTWKLVLPHGCRQYLLDLAIEKASEREKLYTENSTEQDDADLEMIAANNYISHQQCKARFQTYGVLDQLLKKDLITGLPEFWEDDYVDEFESPVLYSDESVDRSDEKALVTWFAGWTMLNLQFYRKFIVVGSTPLKGRVDVQSAKSAAVGIELQKGPLTAALGKRPTPQAANPPRTPAKGWNRSAFREVDGSLSPKAIPSSNNNSFSNPRNQRIESQIGDTMMDHSSVRTNLLSDAGLENIEPRYPEAASGAPQQGSRARHGIDENQPPAILEFIAITGTETETAKSYLSRYNGDVHTAVQRYWYSAGQSSITQRLPQIDGIDGIDESEDAAAVVDFIADTQASAQVAERYLRLAQDDVRRAITLYNESQQCARSPLGKLPNYESTDVKEDVNKNGLLKRQEKRVTFRAPTNGRRESADPQEENLGLLNSNELHRLREARPKSPVSIGKIESNLNTNSADYVHPPSTDLTGALSQMSQVTPTIANSSAVAQSQLLVETAELSHEKIARTLSRPLGKEPEAAHDSSRLWEETYEFREGHRITSRELEYGSNKDIHQNATKLKTTSELHLQQGDIISNYDGLDEKRGVDENRFLKNSGIVTNEAGSHRFVPRSVRPSGTIRPEISIRPGYVPLEDRPVYKNRKVVGGIPQYGDLGSSSGGSSNNSTVQSPVGIDTAKPSLTVASTVPSAASKGFQLGPNFETTVEWYNKIRKNGQGWEHIYVGGWDTCFPKLMNIKK